MGDSDFRAICKHHKAIIIKNIPKISTHTRNIANRFIKLVNLCIKIVGLSLCKQCKAIL